MILDLTNDVKAIKTAILRSRYVAARLANGEMLKLYFAIGGYVSSNSRNGRWGTGVIDEISRLLQKELPGLRGFSAQNMRNMRLFYEEWNELAICQTVSSKLEQAFSDQIPAIPASDLDLPPSRKSEIPADKTDIEICQSLTSKLGPDDSNAMHLPSSGKLDLPADKADIKICQPVASKLGPDDSNAFMSIGFSHHMAIIRACKSLDERLFYIRNAASACHWRHGCAPHGADRRRRRCSTARSSPKASSNVFRFSKSGTPINPPVPTGATCFGRF